MNTNELIDKAGQVATTTAKEPISAIRSAAKAVINEVDEPIGISPQLGQLRDRMDEARRQGVSESEIEHALEEVRQLYPDVATTWPEILGQIMVHVWLENPHGHRVWEVTVTIDRLVWENLDQDLFLADAIRGLRNALEVQWEIIEPAGTSREQRASPLTLPVTTKVKPVAAKAAEFFGSCLMHQHRGVWDCGDKIVVFGNDGYRTDPESPDGG